MLTTEFILINLMNMPTTFEISVWDIARLIPLVINLVLLGFWIRSKVVIHEFLVGRWEGYLRHEAKEGEGKEQVEKLNKFELKCTLMVSKEKGKHDVAYLYYRKIDLEDDRRVVALGLDKLNYYESSMLFFFKRTWKPDFVRVFHKYKNDVDTTGYRYLYDCKIKSPLFKPHMIVSVKFADNTCWTGHWAKA